MIEWLREAIRTLDPKYANLLVFCTPTGIQGSEAVESIKMLAGEHLGTLSITTQCAKSYNITYTHRYLSEGQKRFTYLL
jgi:hypothetical protein